MADVSDWDTAVPSDSETVALDDLTRHLQTERMAEQYWPERLDVRNSLQKTASGKIQKFVLRREMAEVRS